MKILSFRIENFRNLKFVECTDLPEFMVICGGNGCGKTALLEALMTAKEHAGAYGNFNFDSRAVSANAETAIITMNLAISEEERSFVQSKFGAECPETDEIIIEINKGGGAKATKRSGPVHRLLGYYSQAIGSPGYFDYINSERYTQKSQLQTWDASFLSDERAKETLARSQQKFALTKQYLASIKMRDLQQIQTSINAGNLEYIDSLKEIKEFFDLFFALMKFKDVYIDRSPFGFVIETPLGEIDIDDLSSGEKEILNIYIRFNQLKPNGAIILFDEADLHLHPDLERRYLEVLRKLGGNNQLLISTHSPEMMIAAGTDSLYTLLKEPPTDGSNQLKRVTQNEHLHDVLSELMGSRGIISFNQRIIFIEGEYASADRGIYEAMYPPATYNVSFVPAGDSSMVRKTAEQVNALLTTSTGFQQYFSIIDGDIKRFEDDPTGGSRLFRLPVYHVENFLINEREILEVTQAMMGAKCPYSKEDEEREELKKLLLSETHLKAYAKAILDARIAEKAKEAYDNVFKVGKHISLTAEKIEYSVMEKEAKKVLEDAIKDDTWRAKCKGRDLLKAYCGNLGIKYEHFRNLLIERITTPPKGLAEIMEKILSS